MYMYGDIHTCVYVPNSQAKYLSVSDVLTSYSHA